MMTALSNLWNTWLTFMTDFPILAPAIVGIILLSFLADLIKNGFLAGTPAKRTNRDNSEDDKWYTESPHRY